MYYYCNTTVLLYYYCKTEEPQTPNNVDPGPPKQLKTIKEAHPPATNADSGCPPGGGSGDHITAPSSVRLQWPALQAPIPKSIERCSPRGAHVGQRRVAKGCCCFGFLGLGCAAS